ncbi:hypothetical protein N9T00_00145 [bacterium]|nr:hypothetical protein [bacterium]
MRKHTIILLVLVMCGGSDSATTVPDTSTEITENQPEQKTNNIVEEKLSENNITETENSFENEEEYEPEILLTPEEEQRLLKLQSTPEELDGLIEKDYSEVLNVDPNIISGNYLARHCEFTGTYKNIYYDNVPLLDIPLDSSDISTYYSTGLFDNLSTLACDSSWEIEVGIGGDSLVPRDIQKEEGNRRDLYGLSFYDRILPFYEERPEGQQGLWGQWIQAQQSHPFGPAGGTIEGGLWIGDKLGRSKFPKYMANGAALFYNPNSSLSGWGFFERRVDCDCYGGIQITNKILNSPNLISFDEDQQTYDDEGGIYFGHGWMALPLIGGEYRNEIEPASEDIGKLTWTFFMNSAQYSGPTWGYVPEFWYRRIDRWNSTEYYIDSDEASKKVYRDYLAGNITNEELNSYVKSQDWYVDNADDYDYDRGAPFWTEEKNTLAYTSTPYAAIGAEMDPLEAFVEYDAKGDLFLKIFPPEVPSTSQKEYFILDGRFYDVSLYNSFLDLLENKDSTEFLNTSFRKHSEPLEIEKANRERPDLDSNQIYMIDIPEEDLEFQTKKVLSWNMYLDAELNSKGEVSNYWNWGDIDPDNRKVSQYFKVTEGNESKDYKFEPVLESDVPDTLKNLTFKNKDEVKSFMPHVKTEKDLEKEQRIKDNDRKFLGDVDTNPIDFTCWTCDEEIGCDKTIYKNVLDDGSEIYYRWYRFRDQPTFQNLKLDYPEIYTEEYLDTLQDTIEKMHSEWSIKQEFLPVPKTLDNLHLAEIDHGLVVSPPLGLEIGWIPIVLEVKAPYGVYETKFSFLDFDDVGEISGR